MRVRNEQPSMARGCTELIPQILRLHSHVTEDKLHWVYLAPDEDGTRENSRRTGFPSDRIAVVRRLIHPELAEPALPRESWMASSRVIAEPSAHTRLPSASLREFQAGSSI